jgi:hypothetical protein
MCTQAHIAASLTAEVRQQMCSVQQMSEYWAGVVQQAACRRLHTVCTTTQHQDDDEIIITATVAGATAAAAVTHGLRT